VALPDHHITLSNCINSVCASLHPHAVQGAVAEPAHREGGRVLWPRNWASFSNCYRRCSVPEPTVHGTADAVYQNIYSIGSEQPKPHDHLAEITSTRWITAACWTITRNKAEVTWPLCPFADEVPRFGVVEVGHSRRDSRLPREACFHQLSVSVQPNAVDASMGIYIFNTEVLLKALIATPRIRIRSMTLATTSCRICWARRR